MNQHAAGQKAVSPIQEEDHEEGAGLIANAQADASSTTPLDPYDIYKEDQPYEADLGYRGAARFQPESYDPQTHALHDRRQPAQAHAVSTDGYYEVPNASNQPISPDEPQGARPGPDNTQQAVGAALWGSNPHQHPGGPMI
jgi:hypothetical protein